MNSVHREVRNMYMVLIKSEDKSINTTFKVEIEPVSVNNKDTVIN